MRVFKIINLFVVALIVGTISLTSCDSTTSNETDKVDKQVDNRIKVAVFNGNGAGAISVIETIEALKIDKGIAPSEISAADIQLGKLDDIDVIIFPGGSATQELNNLGKSGKEKVRKFILEDGKGAVGICAGSYIMITTPGYPSLKLAGVKYIDRAHYNRGRGLVEFKLGEEGLKIFPELKGKPQFAQYYDGPVVEVIDPKSTTFTERGQYVTDINHKKGYPSGVTPGRTFVYTDKPGKGRIFAIAGHPESTPGIRWMVPRMARWAADAELVSYPAKWVRPEINDHAILFDAKLSKYESQTKWKLYSDDTYEQIEALDKLHEIRSRPAVRWTIGLLRDTNAKTRIRAAKALMDREYTYAYADVKAAYEVEKDKEVKKVLKEAMEFLGTF